MPFKHFIEQFGCCCYGRTGAEDVSRPTTLMGPPKVKLRDAQPKGELQIRSHQRPGHALLVGCDHGRLKGTTNDVESMKGLLAKCGFQRGNITTLTGGDATRAAIERKWKDLLGRIGKDDAVVVYYSGHGGYATPNAAQLGIPAHFQFLIPCDFDPDDPPAKWKGMLDIEISRLLYETTAITPNVTYILDCCHSARLGKAPDSFKGGYAPVAKAWRVQLEDSMFAEIWANAKARCGTLDASSGIPDFTEPGYSNPHVARIAAAAAESTAWQRYGSGDNWVGMMTDSLIKVLSILGRDRSWQNIMLVVGELVERQFNGDPQQPRSAGADCRIPFSMNVDSSTALWADIREGSIIIQGGKALGVEQGDHFIVKPWDKLGFPSTTVVITHVYGFAAEARQLSVETLAPGVAYAALSKRKSCLPIALDQAHAVEPECGREALNNDTQRAVPLASHPLSIPGNYLNEDAAHRFQLAESFNRARRIVSLGVGVAGEAFWPDMSVAVGRMLDDAETELVTIQTRSRRTINPLELQEDDRVYFDITNCTAEEGENAVYVSVLGVDATGGIKILSLAEGERGILLSRSSPCVSLKRDHLRRRGLPIRWPETILSRAEPVSEYFVFVFTDREIDLRFLESSSRDSILEAKGAASGFFVEPTVRYHVTTVRYTLEANLAMRERETARLSVSQLPAPEPYLPGLSDTMEPKGAIFASTRLHGRVPPHIRVVNQHTQEITVVVSKYRPQRHVAAGGLQVSPTGIGLNIKTMTYMTPATQKILVSELQDPQRCIGTFPLWAGGEGFGVITIFIGTGADKVLYIENDQVEAGATVYFRNAPDLDRDLKDVTILPRWRCKRRQPAKAPGQAVTP